ncbi:MAG: PrgI family protein [Patescibacteria group bacterium]|nr:PrgI family protein [Patescibacteria group bacterium]MDD5715468.1 PrgI family protein [Patescibacteria group bacterium]
MQQFVVPQFLDVEGKIIGPLTVRQFLIFLVGAGLIFIVFKLATFWMAAIEGIMIFALTGVFAFLKINGRPFHYFLLNMLQTARRPILKTWNKEIVIQRIKEEKQEKPKPPVPKKKLTLSRLNQLSLVVDTGGAYNEEIEPPEQE